MERRQKLAAVLGTVALLLLLLIGGVGMSTQVLTTTTGNQRTTGTLDGYRVVDGTLILTVSHRGCEEVRGTTVEESFDSVDVTVRLERTSSVCLGMKHQEQVRVTLESPLAGRAVHDGECVKADKPRRECRVEKLQGGPKRT